MRRCILALLALVGSCSALMVGSAPSHAMRVAVSPMMKGRMGSANGGGDPAKSDKKSRGLIRRLITVVRWRPPVRAQRRAMPSVTATLTATCL
jgi:hypothetical protein